MNVAPVSERLFVSLQMVSEHSQEAEGPLQLSEGDEEDLCRVWDMAMDQVSCSVCVSSE